MRILVPGVVSLRNIEPPCGSVISPPLDRHLFPFQRAGSVFVQKHVSELAIEAVIGTVLRLQPDIHEGVTTIDYAYRVIPPVLVRTDDENRGAVWCFE